MTNITGIDIRKGLLGAGLNPNEFDEGAILESCIENSISDWELDGQIIQAFDADGSRVIERFRKEK